MTEISGHINQPWRDSCHNSILTRKLEGLVLHTQMMIYTHWTYVLSLFLTKSLETWADPHKNMDTYIDSVDHNQFASSMEAYKTTKSLRKLYCDKVDSIWLWSGGLSTQPHSKTNTDLHSLLHTFHVLNRISYTDMCKCVTVSSTARRKGDSIFVQVVYPMNEVNLVIYRHVTVHLDIPSLFMMYTL